MREKLGAICQKSLLYKTLNLKLHFTKHFSFVCLIVVDILIALAVYYWISPKIDNTVDEFWRQTGNVADHLNGTITWLRSNPAGLKLNTPVNETLAWFFTYHIYLWTTFIGFLRSDGFLRFLCNFLLLGFSTFSAVLFDFSQIFFLHFSCFDAYATKLCYLCWYTVTVLWSLVRGKKWNPLRKRMDNVHLDTRQQFLATSLFVILLFILPTTFVYFLVFRALKCSVSMLQFVLELSATWPLELIAYWSNLRQFEHKDD